MSTTSRSRPRGQPLSSKSPPFSRTFSGLIREAIFGVNDGLVATVGLVSGESLSHQTHGAIVVAGLSAVGAAVVSMAVGAYLATASQNDFIRKQIADQAEDIRNHPEREQEELGQLLQDIGVPRPVLKHVAANIVSSRPRWLRFMVREELGIHENRLENPLHNALTMGMAVIVGSAPPVVPFVFPLAPVVARNVAWGLSLATALALGAVKGHITGSSVLKSALAFLGLAGVSAAVGAGIGLALGHVGL